MITTSEVAVSLTIDDDRNLGPIIDELETFATIEVDKSQSIVCLVGHSIVDHENTYKLFQILKDVNIRMISYGGSRNNISLLIDTKDKVDTLQKLNEYLFELVTFLNTGLKFLLKEGLYSPSFSYLFIKSSISSASIGIFFIRLKGSPVS